MILHEQFLEIHHMWDQKRNRSIIISNVTVNNRKQSCTCHNQFHDWVLD